MSKMTARVSTLAEPVERCEGAERVERGGAVLRLGPARRLLRRHRAAEDELPVARPGQLVGQLAELLEREIGEWRRRLLIVLVLEPRQVLDPSQDWPDLGRILLPRARPALLVGVLRADLEEEADAVTRHGDLEVAVLLVAAGVGAEGDPRILGRVDGAPHVLGDVREDLAAHRAGDRRRQALAERVELGTNAGAHLGHARSEAFQLEDPEIAGDERRGRHRYSPRLRGRRIRRECSRWGSSRVAGMIDRRRANVNHVLRARLARFNGARETACAVRAAGRRGAGAPAEARR